MIEGDYCLRKDVYGYTVLHYIKNVKQTKNKEEKKEYCLIKSNYRSTALHCATNEKQTKLLLDCFEDLLERNLIIMLILLYIWLKMKIK